MPRVPSHLSLSWGASLQTHINGAGLESARDAPHPYRCHSEPGHGRTLVYSKGILPVTVSEPLVAEGVIRAIHDIKELGTAVLLVEEHAQNALQMADVLAYMELGSLKWMGPRQDVNVDELSAMYLGGDAARTNLTIG